MSVWGGVISQLQPDLLDTPPVTVRCNAVMTDFIAQLDEF
jgi:hypothetical protein